MARINVGRFDIDDTPDPAANEDWIKIKEARMTQTSAEMRVGLQAVMELLKEGTVPFLQAVKLDEEHPEVALAEIESHLRDRLLLVQGAVLWMRLAKG